EELRLLRLMELTGGEVAPEDVDALALQYKLDQDPVLNRWNGVIRTGARVTYLDVQRDGRVDLRGLEAALTDKTILVSVMLANNEIGTVQPIEAIGKLCRSRGILFHTDGVQGVGKVPFDVERMQVDLASVTAHKIYGPKGIGALYVRRKPRVRIAPII